MLDVLENLSIHGALNGMYRRAWATRPTINEAGHAILRFSLFWRILGPIGGVLFLAGAIGLSYSLVVGIMRQGAGRPGVIGVIASVCVFLGWAGLASLLHFPVVRVEIRPDGLWSRSPWRASRFIAWDDIRSVAFATVGKYFVIKAQNGRKIRVDLNLPGIPFLYAVLRRTVPDEYWKNTYPLFERESQVKLRRFLK